MTVNDNIKWQVKIKNTLEVEAGCHQMSRKQPRTYGRLSVSLQPPTLNKKIYHPFGGL